MSARSFGNYDLAGALADLIDNSIKAEARNIRIRCDFNEGDPVVSLRDDGHGMSASELAAAMRPASTNPAEERSPDDLGRFGWGMKSASFSQCRELVVLSARDNEFNGAIWDLDHIGDWTMGVLDGEDASRLISAPFDDGHGTEIIWRNCDRLSESRALTSAGFNEIAFGRGARRGEFPFSFSRQARAGPARIGVRLKIAEVTNGRVRINRTIAMQGEATPLAFFVSPVFRRAPSLLADLVPSVAEPQFRAIVALVFDEFDELAIRDEAA